MSRAADFFSGAWQLVLETFKNFDEDGVPRIAAAMSYFLLLAVAPLILLLNAVLGWVGAVVGSSVATSGAAEAAGASEAAGVASTTIQQVTAWAGSYAPYVAALVVIVGAVSVFSQFVRALEVIWKTPSKRTPLRGFLRDHALSLALVAVTTLALLVAVMVSAVLLMFGSIALEYAKALGIELSGLGLTLLARGVVVFLAAALLFWVAFTVVPDRPVKWRDALPGALITAGLFLIGEMALSYYLSATERFSVFGAFQFFVVLIVWIYYEALVALWGAELTRLLILGAETRRRHAALDEIPT